MSKRHKAFEKLSLVLAKIHPITENQETVFQSDKHLFLHGVAGSGKTFISSYLAFEDIEASEYSKLIIIRSAVPTREIGFLPGNEKEKASVYEEPYKEVAISLFQRGDAYEILKQKGVVEFMTTSFIRGITLRDAVILVDECQNMTFHELDSLITRVGENCRIIFCGDFRQSDIDTRREKSGLNKFIKILKATDRFDFIEFEIQDIVRSGLVKSYIINKERIGHGNEGSN